MDDGVAAMLAELNAGFPAVENMTAPQARAAVAARRAPVDNLDDVAGAVDRVVDAPSGPVRVRIYRPHGSPATRPAVVFCHGGGFVLCDLDTHDGFCRALCRHTESVVISVDYRLAPENSAPGAVDDTVAVFCWVVSAAAELGVDPARVAVAGDSAGGNLTAVTALVCRERDLAMPAAQILIYPVIDPAGDTQSYLTRGTGCMTTAAAMRWYWRNYLGGNGLPEPAYLVAPGRAASHAGLPPTVVVTAGLDPLHDEGVAYARALRSAGVAVIHRDYPDLFHGFATMMPFAAAVSARELLWADIREMLYRATASLG